MLWVLIMVGMTLLGAVHGRWAGAALFAALAVVGFAWARWLRNHPD